MEMNKDGDLNIFLDDFKEEIQKEILEALKLKNAEEGNFDVIPITEIIIPEEEG